MVDLGQFVPEPTPVRSSASRPGRLHHLQHQVAEHGPHRRHDHHSRRQRGARRCPAIKSPSGWSIAASIRPTARTSPNCATPWKSSRSTIPALNSSRKRSDALGFGFRCGFLGLLHMEIVQQRLEGEADVDLVQTAPNVTYEIVTRDGAALQIHKPQEVPDSGQIEEFRQPIVRVNLIQPTDYIGPVMKLCQDRRGVLVRQEYLSPTRAMLVYDMPLAEVIYDLHDKLKSRHPRLRHDGLRADRLSSRPTWCGWTSSSTATASMP